MPAADAARAARDAARKTPFITFDYEATRDAADATACEVACADYKAALTAAETEAVWPECRAIFRAALTDYNVAEAAEVAAKAALEAGD